MCTAIENMKTNLSAILLAAAILLQMTACGSKAKENTETSSASSITVAESSDTATSNTFSSDSSRQASDTDKSSSSSSKAASSKSTSSKAVSSKTAVSKSDSTKESKASSRTSSSAQRQSSPKTTVSVKTEQPKTENTTTAIENPKEEEKTTSSQPVESSSTINEAPSNDSPTVEEPTSSSPREWIQAAPVEADKSTLDPEVAPYAYPYDLDAIRNEMIEYGESLGMHYDDRITLEDSNWSMTTMSADFRDPYEGFDFDPSSFREACLRNISRIPTLYKETPVDWIYFNVLLLPDEERANGDFKVYVPHTIGDYFNYDEWYKSIEDQI